MNAHRGILCLLVGLSAGLLFADPVTRVWKGGLLNEKNEQLWSEPQNWENGCPENGDSVVITNSIAYSTRMDIRDLELVNMTYVDTGVGMNLLSTWPLTLSGRDSFIRATTKMVYMSMKINLLNDAILRFDGDATIGLDTSDMFSGSGTIVKEGAAKYFYANYEHPNFDGVWELKTGAIYIQKGSRIPIHAFGSSKCRIHIYGSACSEGAGTSAGLNVYKATAVDGEFFIHDQAGSVVYQSMIFNGDVHVACPADNTKTTQFKGYVSATDNDDTYPVGFRFNGNFELLDGALASFYNYGYGPRFFVEFNGDRADFGGTNLSISKQTQGGIPGTGSVIRVRATMSSTASKTFFTFSDKSQFYCERPNVLPSDKDIAFGSTSTSTHGAVLDLQGNDQVVKSVLVYCVASGENDSVITSSKGPATFSTAVNAAAAYRTIPRLNGWVSCKIRGSSTNAGAYKFKGGDTAGWIVSGWPIDMGTSMPNLGGLEIFGNCVATISEDTDINENVRLDVHDLTGGCISVASGIDFKSGGVIFDDVDLTVGTYNKVNASWVGGDGSVTIAAHDPTWVWTGKGDGITLSSADNWGVGIAPDLASDKLTLDLRHATAEAPIMLDADVAVKALSFEKGGFVTFTGSKTVTLEGDQILAAAFTESSSLTYAGGGTLILRGGISTTTGTLKVEAGKVVLDGAAWYGKVIVAEDAELEVLPSCEGNPFGTAVDKSLSNIDLEGRLTLGDGVMATVRSMDLGGSVAKKHKTYGSSASAADCVDDVHFAGSGLVRALNGPGFMLIFR